MKHRTSATVMALALLALAALQGRATADSSAPDSDGPTAPATWQPHGTALSGAATSADAPLMKPGTTYQDTIEPGQTKSYAIAVQDARSSAYASAFALPPPGTAVSYGDGIELRLQNSDGTECDSQDVHFGDDGDARPIGTAVARTTGGSGDACQGADQYTLQVHRTSAPTSDPGAWPLELRYVDEPALVAGSALPSAAATPGASPTPLVTGTVWQAHGGQSFETAAAVRTGIWKDRVRPGETRFYRVPVDWGQQATVFADFSDTPVTDTAAFVPDGVRLTAYSPVRQLVGDEDAAYDGAATALVEQLAPVSYGNRAAGDHDVRPVRFAGWYCFAVTVHPGVAKTIRDSLPVTLRVQVQGAAQPAPDYTGNPRAAGIGIDARDVASADGKATDGAAASSSSSAALRFVAFAAFGAGTVLLLTLAVWVLAARWRSGAAGAPGVPVAGGPGHRGRRGRRRGAEARQAR